MKRVFILLVSLLAMMAASISATAQEVTITLTPGWTWISCPSTEAMDFATALGDFAPMEGDLIRSQWGQATYTNGRWRGSVSQFYPGYGYKYKSNRQVPVMVTFNAQQPTQQVTVTTSEPTDITTNSATSGGSITTEAYVFAKGICWATHTSPTQMDDYYSENGNGDESFTAEMTDLSQNTTYYVRAYAVTQDGITYGNEVSFTTIPIWTIEATPNPTEGGTITGTGDYEQNAICNLTSMANEGYVFANWTENGEVVSTDATYTFTVDAARTLVANFDLDHTYVDLGLPSGTLWATCNLGANLPEEYGDYFAWGETQPKDNFSWTNYQYCMGSFNTLTKYCNNPDIGYNGFTDDLTTLLPEDDAATANWGGDWCMPTDEEWQELYQNTTVTWTTRNGVNGRLFTASNGNSLFLPASGYCNESTPEATGIIGDYWTSSLDTDYPSGALSFFFNSSNYYIGFCNRLYGRNVRAVRTGSQSASFVIDATANPVEGGVVIGGGSYQMGAECTLNATASEGYTFINWTENDSVVSTQAIYQFIVTGNLTLVANFTYIQPSYTISVTTNPSVGGIVAGDGTYTEGQSCTVTAIANTNYIFTSWIENGNVVSTDATYTFSVTSNRILVANFNVIYNGHEYVDLGLPSGALWATCNVGATTPEGYGNLYSWIDNYYNMPANMPTIEQWRELANNTTSTWTNQDGVNGRLYISSNGNTLFLPAAGYQIGNAIYSIGSEGDYWSKTPTLNSNSYFVWVFNSSISSNGHSGDFYYSTGCSVRQVLTP